MSTDLPGLEPNKRMQAMVYGYDQMHRIVQARSLTEYKANTGYAAREKKYKKHAPYDVDYSYDPNEDRALRNSPVACFSEGPGCGLAIFTA